MAPRSICSQAFVNNPAYQKPAENGLVFASEIFYLTFLILLLKTSRKIAISTKDEYFKNLKSLW
ncbi:hypothetical protein J7J23_02790 [bacterium]|nr:hypothetical protein [bacterium]